MKIYLALAMVTVGVFGCGAQNLPGGSSHDAGRDLSRPVIDATERNLDDAGCPPEGKMTCLLLGCSDVFVAPQCVHGVWSCPVPPGIDRTCPFDASVRTDGDARPDGPQDGGTAKDAAPSCSSGSTRAPFACGTCGSDTGTSPVCVDGTWTCPPGLGDIGSCPPTVLKCPGPQPSGCSCNPITGVVYCAHDAGADAPSY